MCGAAAPVAKLNGNWAFWTSWGKASWKENQQKLAFVRLQGFKPMTLSYRASVRINKAIPEQADIPTVVNIDLQNPCQDLNPRPKRLWPLHQVVEVQRIPFFIMVQLKTRFQRHKELSNCFYILKLLNMFIYLFITRRHQCYFCSVSCYEVSKDEPQTGIIFGAAANWVRLVPFFDVWAHCRARSPWRETARLIDLVTKGEWDTFLDTFFSSLVALMKEACREKLSLGSHLKIARASLHLYVEPTSVCLALLSSRGKFIFECNSDASKTTNSMPGRSELPLAN